jgi:surface protein
MVGMFSGCSSLTSLDVSNFNTDNVVDMADMFSYCSNLTSLDLSSFNTSKVEYDADNYIWGIEGMFDGCSSLTTIFVGDGWNVENLTESTRVFKDCDVLVGGKGTTYDANHTDYTYAHIDGGPNSDTPGYFTRSGDEPYKFPEPYAVLTDNDEGKTLTFYYDLMKTDRGGLDIGPFSGYPNWQSWYEARENITKVIFDESFAYYTSLKSTAYWFYRCNNLNNITGMEYLNTENVTDMTLMFYFCSSLTSLDLSNFKTDNATKMNGLFGHCTGLTSLDVSKFKTDNVTTMEDMFYNCAGLSSLDVSNFNTDNVINMEYMFCDCSSLTTLDLSNLNTSNVTNMTRMFFGCSSLTSLDVSRLDTRNVQNMYGMFSNCSALTNLDVSNFKTENVTDMSFMFDECSGLTSLDITNFNTTSVTQMSGMFQGCSHLTSLDLSKLNTDKVTQMTYMFDGCSDLKTIYVDRNWSIEAVSYGGEMFRNCTSIEGGAGTPFDPSHTDGEYARIDDPDNSKPGYFTKAGKLGDVNGDGFVNIADAQAMVSYILGTYEGTFNVSLADMNNDGVIDIFDVTLVVNITLEDDTNNPSGSRAFTRGDNSQAEMIRLKAEANNIYLSIDEAERFTAFQFDITLPEGVELTGVELAAGTTDHMLKFVKLRGNRYRVVGLSFTNELLATSNGQLIDLQVSDAIRGNDVSIDNVLFVTPSNKVATHIGGIEHNQQAADDNIYNLSGQKLNVKRQQLSKGVYIINHKKVIIK